MRAKRSMVALLLLAGAQTAGGGEVLDTRSELELTPQARHAVLSEMRGFVVGL